MKKTLLYAYEADAHRYTLHRDASGFVFSAVTPYGSIQLPFSSSEERALSFARSAAESLTPSPVLPELWEEYNA